MKAGQFSVGEERTTSLGQSLGALAGKRILVVEDEAIVGMEIELALEDLGAIVGGPVPTLAGAIEAAEAGDYSAAILDIDLEGQEVYPAARILMRRGIPFVFHTGHGNREELRDEFPASPVCNKPVRSQYLLAKVAELAA